MPSQKPFADILQAKARERQRQRTMLILALIIVGIISLPLILFSIVSATGKRGDNTVVSGKHERTAPSQQSIVVSDSQKGLAARPRDVNERAGSRNEKKEASNGHKDETAAQGDEHFRPTLPVHDDAVLPVADTSKSVNKGVPNSSPKPPTVIPPDAKIDGKQSAVAPERDALGREAAEAVAGREEEALYQGKPAGFWVKSLGSDKDVDRATKALETLGPAAKAFVPELRKLLNAKQATPLETAKYRAVRKGSLRALGAIGPDARAAIPDIIKLVRDTNEKQTDLGHEAIVALGKICRYQRAENPDEAAVRKEVVPVLIEALDDTRYDAAEALGEIGPRADAAIPALMEHLAKTKSLTTADAIGKIGKAAVPILIKTLSDKDVDLQRLAVEALGKIGPEARDALPAIKARNDRSAWMREIIKKIEGGI